MIGILPGKRTRKPELCYETPEPGGPIECFERIVGDLKAKCANAAQRNKPTMWAYYHKTVVGLEEWFEDVTPTDGGYAGAALALSQKATAQCPSLPPYQAARLWALGVYARRILQAWGVGLERVSLDWLHDRAEEAA